MKSKDLKSTMSSDESENDLERANLLCDMFAKYATEKRKAFIKVAKTIKTVDNVSQIGTALNLYNQFHRLYGRSEYLRRQVYLMFKKYQSHLAELEY